MSVVDVLILLTLPLLDRRYSYPELLTAGWVIAKQVSDATGGSAAPAMPDSAWRALKNAQILAAVGI
jgi:hypothetical protein